MTGSFDHLLIVAGRCPRCDGTQWVCEEHPDLPYGDISDHPKACHCGGAGMPCPDCWPSLPADDQ